MATKQDLDSLVELGRLIPDKEKRRHHLDILEGIAERIGVSLESDEELAGQDDAEAEQERDEQSRVDEELREKQAREEEQKRKRAEAEKREQQEKKRADEERARKQAEQRKKQQEEKEAREREAREKETKDAETRMKRASFRKSLNLSNTGNSLDEVLARIPKPTPRSADLTDPAVAQVYVDVREDSHSTDWMILRYEGQTNKLIVSNSGSGGFQELAKYLVEEPLYGYFRHTFGDTNRTKFIFLNYVPESLGGLKKAKVAGHKPEVAAFLKYFHVEINALSRDDISVKNVETKLRAAGGADYGSGRGGGTSGGENFGGIKANAANFYAKTDKQSKVDIVYQKGPLTTTPIDLAGRPMVAAASEARKNIIDLSP